MTCVERSSRPSAGAVKAIAFWCTLVKCVAFHDIPLHTEKPPYRFPHTAADCLFAEQVAVCAGAGQRQHQNIILYAIDKQPVRENMTFPMTCPIAGQVMVAVLIRQRFAHCQQCYDLLQQLDLQATLYGSFVVFFETGRVLDGIFGFFHLFRSAKLNRNPSFQFASLSSDLANRLLSCIINIFSRTIYMQFSGTG